MLKFKDYVYQETDIEKVEQEVEVLLQRFQEAKTAAKQIALILEIDAYRRVVETNFALMYVRFTLNTNDPYYTKQNDIIDEITPRYSALGHRYYQALLDSPFKKAIAKKFGNVLLKKAEVAIKTFDPVIMEDMVEENKLSSRYSKLLASAQIRFKKETLNLSQLGKYMQDVDRRTRAAASKAYYGWFASQQDELDEIYDKMVKVRDTMAKKLGFSNFVELGYLRMGRVDYTAKDVAQYRDQVYRHVVPITKSLFRKQAKRLGIKGMKYYDYNLQFLSGNPLPAGDKDYLVNVASTMYDAMSPETSEFFRFMKENELMDLEARKGKAGGGYCTTFPAYKSPFVFANFNGTSGDVDVLTHEMGHAFMAYEGRNVDLIEQGWPTMEACEIHSMSMEFFAYPWVDQFFKQDADKYRISHITGALTFIPYGVAVDEFQHFVYENVTATPVERRAKWREIEKKYLPHMKYGTNEFLNNGGRWMRQAHIYQSPFYYIDYTLAQVSAYEFFNHWRENPKEAWDRYVALCQLGGSKTYLELLKSVQLSNPFKKGSLKKIVLPLKAYLETLDSLDVK